MPTSYLAIVTLLDDTATAPHTPLHYHIAELSGTLGIDTVVTRNASDTVILDLPPATYTVSVAGLPATCGIARGTVQLVVVYPPPSTALARYFVLCKPTLTLATLSDGAQPDPQYIWRVEGSGGSRLGTIHANDTLTIEGLTPGRYTVSLDHVAGNCVVTSDGADTQALTIDSTGGALVLFRVTCSDEAKRPRLLSFAASYHDGASALVFRAVDPDRDIERYVWDLTDCHGTSVVPGGARLRRGLTVGRTAQADTVQVVSAFEVGLPDSAVKGRCTTLRVADEFGNTTATAERPITVDAGSRPAPTSFNAIYVGTGAVRTDVQVLDPDGDFAGYFFAATVRDGVLFTPDGQPDVGIYNTAGFLTAPLPDIPLGAGRLMFGDVLSVIVYLVDARGHFTRAQDTDLFH